MKIRLFGRVIDEQLEFLLPRALLADLLVFIAVLPFYGLDHRIITGLLLGTAAMTVNMILLGYSVQEAVEKPTAKAAKRYMFGFYIIRFAIMGTALVIGFKLEFFNSVCTFIPLLWPKIIYTGTAIFDRDK